MSGHFLGVVGREDIFILAVTEAGPRIDQLSTATLHTSLALRVCSPCQTDYGMWTASAGSTDINLKVNAAPGAEQTGDLSKSAAVTGFLSLLRADSVTVISQRGSVSVRNLYIVSYTYFKGLFTLDQCYLRRNSVLRHDSTSLEVLRDKV